MNTTLQYVMDHTEATTKTESLLKTLRYADQRARSGTSLSIFTTDLSDEHTHFATDQQVVHLLHEGYALKMVARVTAYNITTPSLPLPEREILVNGQPTGYTNYEVANMLMDQEFTDLWEGIKQFFSTETRSGKFTESQLAAAFISVGYINDVHNIMEAT